MTRPAIESQIGPYFANDGRELKAMTGEAATQDEVGMLGMAIDYKIFVGS